MSLPSQANNVGAATGPVLHRLQNTLLALSIAAAAVLPYLNALPNDFVWDDRTLILDDYQIRSVRYLGKIIRRDFFAFSENQVKYGYYRPLVTLSYMVDLAVWGPNPWGFRLTNILFHAACSLLVVRLARRLRLGVAMTPWLAGLLFALHPVHTESVTWIAGRTDVMATSFFLLALLLYVGGYESPGGASRGIWLSMPSWIAAALMKETALVFPAFVALYHWGLRRESLARAVSRAVPFVVVVVAYILWRSVGTATRWNTTGFRDPVFWIGGALTTLWRYVALLLWPASLSAYIQNPPPRVLWDPSLWAGVAVLTGSIGLYFRYRLRNTLAWTIPAFLIALAPVMNVIRISAPADMGFPMAERFLYLPSVFFCVALAGLLQNTIPSTRVRIVLVMMVAGAFAARIVSRNRDWRDEVTFFRTCLRTAPNAPLLHAALGCSLLTMGNTAEAISELRQALDLSFAQSPQESPFLLNNLAVAYRMAGQYDEVLATLDRISPTFDYPAVYYNRGAALAALGKWADAEDAFRKALQRDPHHLESWVALGQLLQRQRRWADATFCYRKAVVLFPREASLFNLLGIALKNEGRLDEAAEAFEKALQLNPADSVVCGNLGVVLALRGQTAAAEKELRAALALNSRHEDAWNALGTLYALQRRYADAEKCFDAVLKMNPTQAEALVNKGVLRLQEGHTTEAVLLFEQAFASEPDHPRARSYLRQLSRPSQPHK